MCDTCQGIEKPYFFPYDSLTGRRKKGKRIVSCDISYEDVNIQSLLEGIEKPFNIPKIKSLVRQGKIEKVLDELWLINSSRNTSNNQLTHLSARYAELKKRIASRTILESDRLVEMANIIEAILDYLDEPGG